MIKETKRGTWRSTGILIVCGVLVVVAIVLLAVMLSSRENGSTDGVNDLPQEKIFYVGASEGTAWDTYQSMLDGFKSAATVDSVDMLSLYASDMNSMTVLMIDGDWLQGHINDTQLPSTTSVILLKETIVIVVGNNTSLLYDLLVKTDWGAQSLGDVGNYWLGNPAASGYVLTQAEYPGGQDYYWGSVFSTGSSSIAEIAEDISGWLTSIAANR